MELISTHIGADFDAFASMLAARRLYPSAQLFFPGSREESLRRMLDTGLVDFEELRRRQIDPDRVERVVLCDSRQRRRIGILADWLAARPSIEVLAYDHHPASDDDLELAGGRVDAAVGATSTLMSEVLRERAIPVSPLDATLLLMGIYEDTGSLTYASTSTRDFAAASWLLEQGGDLAAVRRWALYRLDSVHLDMLHRMTREIELVRLRGHRVGVVALELGEFVDELAPLVSRCVELFELPLLFALFGDGNHVTLIARGNAPGIDLGKLLVGFGGGGHATAAAARVAGRTVLEVREDLLALLDRELPPAARAGDLAIHDFVVLAPGTTVARAKEVLTERRVNSAPVAQAGSPGRPGSPIAGAVSRQLLDAALQHGLGERRVERVMETDLEWVDADAPAEEVARRMLVRHPRFVLVGDAETARAEGLIARMQVLHHLHSRLAEQEVALDRSQHLRERRESAARLLANLAPPVALRVETARRLAREHGITIYLVGGLVRDLLLGRDNRDLDLVVEGDGIHFARLLAGELGGRVREHQAFMTAVVVDEEAGGKEFHIDVATARSEFYREPAALPQVATSVLRQDLYRRDFTINTLAIRLGPGKTPELIDYFGGRRDLEDRVLRVLHSLSFIDDPTRVLRAIRLEERLDFTISPETLQLAEIALAEGIFERLSGSRLRDELRLLLDDPAVALRGLDRLSELRLLPILDPALLLTPALRARLRDAVGAFHWFRLEALPEPRVELWRLLLVTLTESLHEAPGAADGGPVPGAERLADRLMLAGEDREVVVGAAHRLAAARRVLARPGVRPHEVAEGLEGLRGEDLLLLLGCEDSPARDWVRRDLTELRRFRLDVRGADLLAAGLAPGPAIGLALRRTRAARLDGEIGQDEEQEFAVRAARELQEEG